MERQRMSAFSELVDIMAKLRGPNGCPWDAEQTHATLTRYLIEECHEVVDAVDDGDDTKLAEELGDLLLQIVFHARIAEERGAFDMSDVCRGIAEKLVRRHPHVFGDVAVSGAAEVLQNWEAIKRDERREAGQACSVLSGVPRSLPSLPRAQAVQKKAASVGFDWDDVSGPLDKLAEEIGELREAIGAADTERATEEVGDLLFAVVNVARLLNIDADGALRGGVSKFEARFRHIEESAALAGRDVRGMSIHEMDRLWEEAKASEGV